MIETLSIAAAALVVIIIVAAAAYQSGKIDADIKHQYQSGRRHNDAKRLV